MDKLDVFLFFLDFAPVCSRLFFDVLIALADGTLAILIVGFNYVSAMLIRPGLRFNINGKSQGCEQAGDDPHHFAEHYKTHLKSSHSLVDSVFS